MKRPLLIQKKTCGLQTGRYNGFMRSRGQKITLKHKETGEVRNLRVVLSDSKQGYLASAPTGIADHFDWDWYHPSEWSEVK